MELIARYRNAGFEALAAGVMAFFDRRADLQRPGVAFGPEGAGDPAAEPAKISTDISLVAIDRSDPEAFALAEVILRGVNAALGQYLKERPLLRDCCPEQSLFVNPIFNLQRYASATRPPSPRRGCWPGSSTAIPCPMAAPSFTGRAITRRQSGASW
jgi:hypothetical protein